MKAFIHTPAASTGWCHQFFPDYPPYLLPIVNKPYLEFLIEFCTKWEISDIRIISDIPHADLYDIIGDGSKYGVNISFTTSKPNSSLKNIISKNRNFIGENESLLILSGLIWIPYNLKEKSPKPSIAPNDIHLKMFNQRDGWIILGSQAIDTLPEKIQHSTGKTFIKEISKIDSINKYYQLNIDTLSNHSSEYNLPGYSSEKDIFIGKSFILEQNCQLSPPLAIDDDVCILHHTTINNGVIIGKNTIIDHNTTIENSIILPNAYIGSNLEINGRICSGNSIIDPYNEMKIDINDEHLISSTVAPKALHTPFLQRLTALLLIILMAIPYLIFRPLVHLKSNRNQYFINSKKYIFLHFKYYSYSLLGNLFLRFNLQYFGLLMLVINGKMRLIGNALLIVDDANARMLKQFPDYAPGIFSLSEYLHHQNNIEQKNIDEFYYAQNSSFMLNIKIFFGCIWSNFIGLKG